MRCTDTISIKIFDLSLIFLQNEADPVKYTNIPYERIDVDKFNCFRYSRRYNKSSIKY